MKGVRVLGLWMVFLEVVGSGAGGSFVLCPRVLSSATDVEWRAVLTRGAGVRDGPTELASRVCEALNILEMSLRYTRVTFSWKLCRVLTM